MKNFDRKIVLDDRKGKLLFITYVHYITEIDNMVTSSSFQNGFDSIIMYTNGSQLALSHGPL